MRNILTVLTLCVLTLTTSSVFAESYDNSKRTERFGLSYYDGRPLYVVMFGYTSDANGKPIGYGMSYYRMYTGDDLADFGDKNHNPKYGLGREATVTYGDLTVQERYFYSVIDADGMVVYTTNPNYSYPYYDWTLKLLERYPPPQYTSEDLAVKTYDEIAPEAQSWARRGIMLAVLLLTLSAGLNKFRELTSGGAQTTGKDAKKVDGAASPNEAKPKVKRKIDTSEYLDLEHESPYRLRTPRELREERARFDRENITRQSEMSEQEALREAYISGDYWGKSFSDEVRENNRQLYEAFDKMDAFNRRLLIQKFDEMSFTQEANLLKSYNKDVYGFADDNIGNPFEGEDDEDGEPPF